MNIICLDLEGVLAPEIWEAVAAASGIDQLGGPEAIKTRVPNRPRVRAFGHP